MDHLHQHEDAPHTHEHTHVHSHDGHSHEHTHSHPHSHAPGTQEEHSHSHPESTPAQQTVALLRYMLDHNIHHAAELEELAGQVGGEAGHLLLHAVETFRLANDQLDQALKLMK